MNLAEKMNLNFESVIEVVRAFQDEDTCIRYLEELIWGDKPVSPFDPVSKVYKCKNGKYKCKNTGKYFTIKTGTIFAGSKVKLQDWLVTIWLDASHKGGLSSMQLMRDLKKTQKTTWFMLQKLRKCMGFENKGTLEGEVEIDETYIGGKNKNRHYNKKIKDSQGRSTKDKVPVLGMIERNGKVIAMVVPNTTAKELIPRILRRVDCCSTIYTDEWSAYKSLKNTYKHEIVNHCGHQYVDGKAYTNNIENFWSQLKRAIIGVWRVVSSKHLQLYVNEFVFRRNTMKYTPKERFLYILKNIKGYNLTYRQLKNAC